MTPILKLLVKFDGLALLSLLRLLPHEVYLWSLSIFEKKSAQCLSCVRSISLSKVSSFLHFSLGLSSWHSTDWVLLWCISTSWWAIAKSSFSYVFISNDGFNFGFLARIFSALERSQRSESDSFVSWCRYLLDIGLVCVLSAFEVLIISSALTNTFSYCISCELLVVYRSREAVPSSNPKPLKCTYCEWSKVVSYCRFLFGLELLPWESEGQTSSRIEVYVWEPCRTSEVWL